MDNARNEVIWITFLNFSQLSFQHCHRATVLLSALEPRLIVDEQKDAVKLLKEYLDIDDIDPNEKKMLFV